jgi:hypothetical protein
MNTQEKGQQKQCLNLSDFVNAPCFGMTEIFFHYSDQKSKIAIRICNTCSYKEDCLDLAIARGEFNGVWGGFNFSNHRARTKFMKELRCINQMMNG